MIMLIQKYLITLKLRFSRHNLLLSTVCITGTVTRQKDKYLKQCRYEHYAIVYSYKE